MFNDFDFMMGLTAIGPIGFLVSVGIVAFLGWLIKR